MKVVIRILGVLGFFVLFSGLLFFALQTTKHILPKEQKSSPSFAAIRVKEISKEEYKQPIASQSAQLPPIIIGEKAFKVPILLYHYVSLNGKKEDTMRTALSTPPAIFDQQLTFLSQQGYATITLDELAAAFDGKFTLPAKSVILTFDDGYADFYFNAAPILQKHQMKGIAFIPTGLIGGGNYMTWGQIEELAKSPFIAFGAHSVHHYALSKVAPNVLVNEVEESKRILESHVGYRVNWFAYPYGFLNDAVIEEVKKAEFIGSVTTVPGSWQYQSRFFHIPRLRAGTRIGESLLKLLE